MTTPPTQSIPAAPPPAPHNGKATAGFWLGIVGLVAGLLPFLGFAVTVPALLLSRTARKRFRDGVAATPGRSGAGIVLGWIGIALCALMTVAVFVLPATPAPQPVAAPVAPAPVLITVPNVVGMGDQQARDTLRTAGFTSVVLGPSTGPHAGIAAGTVTTQLPGVGARASAGDPIVLGEASAPPAPAPVVVPQSAPAPVVVPQAAPTTETAPQTEIPTTRAARPFVPAPQTDVDSAPAPQTAADSSGGGGSAYYENCSEARAAGAAPLSTGDPGYRGELDRDDDGVACE